MENCQIDSKTALIEDERQHVDYGLQYGRLSWLCRWKIRTIQENCAGIRLHIKS